tara:strand:- start:299 stop:1162 length:864 start_codon:yes stop_codon:yes gene_type:complete
MVSSEILNSHAVTTLKKEISKTNIKGYSKMKKPEIVALMMKNKDRFGHITHKEKAAVKPAAVKPAAPKITITEVKDKKKIKKSEAKSQLPPLKEKAMKLKLPKKEEPKKEKLIQIVNEYNDNNRKVFNMYNRNAVEDGKPQFKTFGEFQSEMKARKNKRAAEERAKTRARNEKKKKARELEVGLTKDEEVVKKLVGEANYTNIQKIIKSPALQNKTIHIMSMIRAFFPISHTEKLIEKKGVDGMFKTYKNMISKLTKKNIFIPKHDGEFEGKGLPKSLYNSILSHLM